MISDRLLGKSDVLIIGGGIVGCATAYFLAKRGVAVRVLERGSIAGEQSSRAWGFVRQQGRHPAEVPLAAEASRLWETLGADLQADLEFVRSGIAVPAETEADEARLTEQARVAKEFGLSTRMLGASELKRLIPELGGEWRSALFTAEDGHAEPRKATQAFAAAAERLGAHISSAAPVTAIEADEGTASAARTIQGRYSAESIICAAGVGSASLLRTAGVSVPIQVVSTSVAQTRRAPPFTRIAMWGPYCSCRPRPDGSFYVGGGYRGAGADYDITTESLRNLSLFLPAYRRNWRKLRPRFGRQLARELRYAIRPEARFDPQPEPIPRSVKLAYNERHFYALFPHLHDLGIARSWAGRIDLTPDLIPIIGRVGSRGNLYVAAGFSGHGFALGPVIGKLLAELVCDGTASADLSKFRPGRFADGDFALPDGAL